MEAKCPNTSTVFHQQFIHIWDAQLEESKSIFEYVAWLNVESVTLKIIVVIIILVLEIY